MLCPRHVAFRPHSTAFCGSPSTLRTPLGRIDLETWSMDIRESRKAAMQRISGRLAFSPGCMFLSGILCLASPCWNRADELSLKSGGTLFGKAAEVDAKSSVYQIVSPGGATWSIAKQQAERPRALSKVEQEYLGKAPRTLDSAEAQWELAVWCFENKLREQGEQHAQRVIELEPAHALARRKLRYELVDGEWMTRDQKMARQGFFPYKGKYRTQQEIDLLKEGEQSAKLEGEWVRPVKTYAKWLQDPKKYEQARRKLLEIKDPAAAPALASAMQKEPNPELRGVLVECLGRLPDGRGLLALVDGALFDEDTEVRLTCLDYLKMAPHKEGLVVKFIDALKHKDVDIIRRAGEALGVLGDAAAVDPLIDALIVVRTETVQAPTNDYNMTFGNLNNNPLGGSGGAFGMGKLPTRKVAYEVRIDECLKALETITGQNFGYNIEAWKAWQGNQSAPEMVDLRRDAQ